MKNTLLVTMIFIGINFCFSQQTKILFLGNSFTYVYDVPAIFEQLALEAGESVFVDTYADPGIALGTWTGAAGHNVLSGSLNKINSQDWDFIIVQDNLGIWVGSSPYQEAYDDLVENRANILANNSCTEIIYFAGWCPVGGVQSGDSESTCGTRVYDNFIDVNTNGNLNEIVSPVALAWNQSMSQQPGVDLYYSDDTHASINGAYLAAATIFVSTLKKDPTQLSWYPTNWYDGSSMSSNVASNMRQIAWDVVTNGTIFNDTNLDGHTPVITESGSILTASGYSTYQWYLNGTAVNGATLSSYSPTTSGVYTVIGYDGSGCDFSSFEIDFTASSAGIDELADNKLNVYPNPSSSFMNVTFNENIDAINIYSLTGQKVLSLDNILQSKIQINVSQLEAGSYLLVVKSNGTTLTKNIQVIK